MRPPEKLKPLFTHLVRCVDRRTHSIYTIHFSRTLNLSVTEFSLICLVKDNPLSQKAVAEALCSNNNAIVKVVDSLENKGFVTRDINPYNRREHELRLTDAGETVFKAGMVSLSSFNKRMFHNLTDKDISEINRLLLKLLE